MIDESLRDKRYARKDAKEKPQQEYLRSFTWERRHLAGSRQGWRRSR